MRDSTRSIDDPFEFLLPRGEIPPCGYTVDTETREMCGEPPVYVLRLVGWAPEVRGTACLEHGQVIRTWGNLESIRSL